MEAYLGAKNDSRVGPDKDSFLDRCAEIRKLAFSFKDPLLVHHYDADGLSSGALVLGSFLKQGRNIRRECIKKLDDAAIERYMKTGEREIIFTDLGGGNKRVNELKDIVIIDHHQTEGVTKPQANPLLFGIDGGDELSASGTAYCVFREYVELGVVGAVGDMQSPLRGMNQWMVEEGEKTGEVRTEDDIKLYGRYCRPLVQFLAYSDDPYIPGISYREDKATELLNDLRIDLQKNKDGKEKTYSDLEDGEKRRLVSALAVAIGDSEGKRLMSKMHVFPKRPNNETYEANSFSTLLNACGRHGKDNVGINVCLGDVGSYKEAEVLLKLHRKMLRDGISFAGKSTQDLGAFYFLDGRGIIDEGIIGVVCGMTLQQTWKKPIIGLSLGEEESVKVSGRAPRHLIAAGLNLGQMMKEATTEVGGAGGGHRIAAGASIPKAKLNEFLIICGGIIASNVNNGSDEKG